MFLHYIIKKKVVNICHHLTQTDKKFVNNLWNSFWMNLKLLTNTIFVYFIVFWHNLNKTEIEIVEETERKQFMKWYHSLFYLKVKQGNYFREQRSSLNWNHKLTILPTWRDREKKGKRRMINEKWKNVGVIPCFACRAMEPEKRGRVHYF